MKKKEKKEKQKDNQYKLNKAMAIAIGLMQVPFQRKSLKNKGSVMLSIPKFLYQKALMISNGNL